MLSFGAVNNVDSAQTQGRYRIVLNDSAPQHINNIGYCLKLGKYKYVKA